MAEVFLARRLGPAGFTRDVALKCMLAGLDLDERTRRAFVYEARLAARLRHPNIAEAHDLAVLDGRYYLVLEYVDGVTAKAASEAARSAGRRLSEALCCHVAASVAEALHHAHALTGDDGHALGIVHRDVKASNVMIARSGAVKLLDFGVAYARLEGRDRTRTGQQRGTYSYFSPEQASEEVLDGRSDLFSLGIVLVELLTGNRVFDTGSEVGTLQKIAECDPTDVAAATEDLPSGLAAICARALAKERGERFQDGTEFSRALRDYLASLGKAYWPSDCAAELREFGLLDAPGRPAPRGSSGDGSEGWTARGAVAENEVAARSPPTRSAGRQISARRWATAALAAGTLAATLWGAARFVEARRRSTLAAMPAPSSEPVQTRTPVDILKGPVPPPLAQPPALEAKVDALVEPVVRPKRTAKAGGRSATQEREPPPPERTPQRSRPAEFADRPSVGSARATLPRGTLVPARLVSSLDATHPGQASAEVAEEVVAEGMPAVPKGSTLACTARLPRDGRVPLTCDRITAGDRELTFSGVAVGEGQRVGLRAVDNEVAAGTSFVVYVNAPAAVR
ncbi:hypothetical protein AMPC_17560 [Anaeromyxobacter paludicola]|uniref:Protein kinase domain-containing protein n=2 Tax=Anaeromyxobacter paludicola TaxID=2918171 RepID=A0ABM7X9W7_9BACT|nr:hypothetical protein AMPC_17560 [Anaeromyxobacter paludicola]